MKLKFVATLRFHDGNSETVFKAGRPEGEDSPRAALRALFEEHDEREIIEQFENGSAATIEIRATLPAIPPPPPTAETMTWK